MSGNKKYSFVILPHWRIEGGAGYYIRDLIESLRPVGTVQVGGPYASDYDEVPIQCKDFDKLTLQSMPAYEGIRLAAFLYHILISALRAIALTATPWDKRFEGRFDALVLTSSVQAMAIPIARRWFPGRRIAIVVQENVCLSRGLGRLTSVFLKRADVVVSITETWAQHARENGLDPVVLPNSFAPDYAALEHNRNPAIEADLLYVGGSAKIKGFDNLIAALPELLSVPGRSIVCLGQYSEAAIKTLEQILSKAHPNAQLNIVGLVPDIRPYLRETKLLLLPIGSPHFCRPAIEAGLFKRAFVIPNFPELGDFALDGENCVTYRPLDIEDFVLKVSQLLNDPALMRRLGESNNALANKFINVSKPAQAFVERLTDSTLPANKSLGPGAEL